MTDAIKTGDTISVDYTGKHEDGTVFDTSQGKAPMKFTVGSGMLINGFDTAVIGMKKGESKTVVIPPEEGYGLINQEAFVDIPRAGIPEDIPLVEGMQLTLEDPEGRPVPAIVSRINEDSVQMDLNHFLAGQTLTFDICIKETGLAPEEHQCGCTSQDCGSGDCGSGSCGSDPQGGCGCGN